MNAKILLAAATLGVLAFSGAARADDADASQQFAIKFQGSRTQAEVMAEAAQVSAKRNIDQPGARAIAPLQSSVDVQTVRAQAIDALRLGKIPSGERSL